ncbi:hypothetical protein CTI12_AA263650 [Artemisia annua]|uniref:Uncharacterized protein n=1 Tax=Artemisia annua TaxID=35608 RepID=A0A2U1ME81_ARTAN|nr:hypothetical protein CTI12_AA263650 [Artemisia annua]
MEGISTKVYKGVKGYWRRRRYQRLGSDSVRQKRPFWRGAYGTYGGYGDGVASFGMRPVKEYDEKMVIEIYKALAMRQSQLVPIDESKVVVSR